MEKYKQALHPGTPVRSTENVYVIEKVLGQGSFGITYLASTYMKGNRGKARVLVALKEFFAEDLDVRCGDGAVASRTMDGIAHKYAKAFQRESENLSKMDHPGIVHVMEAFEANGTYYYSMEYLSGGSLDDKVRGGGMPEADALPLIAKIGDALSEFAPAGTEFTAYGDDIHACSFPKRSEPGTPHGSYIKNIVQSERNVNRIDTNRRGIGKDTCKRAAFGVQ